MKAPKIFIVDDDADYLDFLHEVLEEQNYDITTSMSAVNALKLLKKTRFDLVILDVVMPDGNGFEICREIRESKRNKDAMVIMLTGKRVAVEDMIQGLEIGADEYLLKPVTAGELIVRVRAMLRTRRLQKEVYKLEDKEVYFKKVQAILTTLGEYLSEASTSLSSYSEYAEMKSNKQFHSFQEMVVHKTQIISVVLEILQEVIIKMDSGMDNISVSDIDGIEEKLKHKLSTISVK